MRVKDDPFEVLIVESDSSSSQRKRTMLTEPVAAVPGVATAQLHGLGLEDEALVTGIPGLVGEIIAAQTTVPLFRRQIGSKVVVVFEQGDSRRPIIIGVLQEGRVPERTAPAPQPVVSINLDDDRIVLSAEREISLRCGEASITLTRAGKVIIKGAYVLSRSSGLNRIKGAAVDIN